MITHLNIGTVSFEERSKLTIAQQAVLAAHRQLQSVEAVAYLYGRDSLAIAQMLIRIRRLGVAV
ncbi:hypothetical protein KW797_00465 [Candidatus Parcubacteria bacterium]|nr:hypothetical protein [Candidatus Parcubacteria bacterium]